MMFLRSIFTLARQLTVAALYLVSLACVLVAYNMIEQGNYLTAFVLAIIIPAVAIFLHILISKYLKRFDLKPDKDFEELHQRNNSINRLFN